MDSLTKTLMNRDGLTRDEAEAQVSEAREELMDLIAEGNFSDAYDICDDMFGLEPDYLEDLLF